MDHLVRRGLVELNIARDESVDVVAAGEGHNFRVEISLLEIALFLRDVSGHVHGTANPFADNDRLRLRSATARHQADHSHCSQSAINKALHGNSYSFSVRSLMCNRN